MSVTRDRLVIDTPTVRSLADNLGTVQGTLEDAAVTSSSLAGSVGDPHLADVVTDFASKWDNRRKEMVTQVETVQKNARAVADGFEHTDQEVAKASTRQAAAAK